MNKLGLITIALLFANNTKSQIPLTIDLEIDTIQYNIFTKDLTFDGTLCFTNNTDKSITLPKTFDLELNLSDSSGNDVKLNRDVIFEYVNLLNSHKRQTIKSHLAVIFKFTEWRLFAYPLIINNKYSVQYSFVSKNYPGLIKELGQKTFKSNKKQIKIPAH
jgi:hypothetical protein